MPDVPEVIGHFDVVRLLGKGAMGEVYEGVDKDLGRRVALKILGARHRESREFKERFLREGRALAAMNHPNIVQIYAIGEHERRPFLAMEFLDGEDLGQAIKKRGPLHPGDAAEAIRQAAIGLAQAQRADVVHRDVKPSNLVVTSAGVVKVTDFGLAKALQEDLSITATGVFVGTPDYLAPEQAMGEEVDARADVYALGCSLFHMCSGHPPFRKGGQDDHYTAVVRRHLKAERPQLKLEIQGFDEELSDLCRRMMSRRPDIRPTFDELVEKLGVISRRLGGQIPPRHQDVELVESQSTDIDSPAVEEELPSTRGWSTTMVAVVAGVAIGVGITVGVLLMAS
ncbi:MAG: serine/threonine protein kinase [Myxococcales bacterium]|nr:serine/threonine protein kinase [Myxococcales bacterium]MCB9716489.1 serine/threonine protein kinase [Myxococcales bacterium]